MTYLQVSVRDREFKIKLRKSNNTFKWLGYVAAARYARESKLLIHPDKLVCSSMAALNTGNYMHPKYKIREHCAEGEKIMVTLTRFRDGDRKSQWQVYAETSESDYVPVEVVYNGERPTDGQGVHLHSNHDMYNRSIRMKDDGKKISTLIHVPPGAELNFFFEVNGTKRLSSNYDKRTRHLYLGKMSFEQNIKSVPESDLKGPLWRPVNLLRGMDKWMKEDPTPPPQRPPKPKPWTYQVPNTPKGTNFDEVFTKDWREIQLNDVVPSPEARRAIASVLRENWGALQQIFRYISCHKEPIQFMSQMQFISFMGQLKIYDSNFRPSDAEDVFKRVNIEEDYGSDDSLEGIRGNAETARIGGFSLSGDDENPDNMFIRSEFLESLIRVALRKFPDEDEEDAVEEMLGIVKKKNQTAINEMARVRAMMHTDEVRDAYVPYLKKLYKVYLKCAGLDQLESREELELISYREYGTWMRFHGLLATSENKHHAKGLGLTRREATLAFGLAMIPDKASLNWPCFLEMTVRVAEKMFKGVSIGEACTRLLTYLCKTKTSHLGLKIHLGSLTIH